ncbi:DUF3152 domain-containing protein [Cryptosporangium aurantiacum]|uniref:DUF3152 domain-containing protein n=1 Tax=Cryptosporangium aurantiacum TaxID=134849 RepID=UPI0015BBBB83|nr:DUF3152 domain-containing protein [Cryptosporangium aurantiacum]
MRGRHHPDSANEARRALRSEIRQGRRPGDRPASAPPHSSVSATYLRAQRQAARRRAARRRRRFLVLLVLFTALLVLVDLVRGGSRTEHEQAERTRTTGRATPSAAVSTQPSTNPSAEAIQPEASPTASTAVTVPARGSGAFTAAGGTTPVRGSTGTLVRYQVKVERGSGQKPDDFAAAVDATLSDPRGWTAAKKWRFQRVTGGSVDAVILLATPETTNRICRAGGLDPAGYTSCRTGDQVVINLARWLLAVPAFKGDLPTYRQYVVNHEMGHQLGHGHVRCGGRGKPAPVMQQQTLGLQGCTPNAWPYVNGRYLSGQPTAGQ